VKCLCLLARIDADGFEKGHETLGQEALSSCDVISTRDATTSLGTAHADLRIRALGRDSVAGELGLSESCHCETRP
jgi:hypothetical protein